MLDLVALLKKTRVEALEGPAPLRGRDRFKAGELARAEGHTLRVTRRR